MAQSELLTQFYRHYLKWLAEGAIPGKPFSRNVGLCSGLVNFHYKWGLDNSVYVELDNEMVRQFEESKLKLDSPFHFTIGGYFYESNQGKAHLNEKRIQWVMDHAVID